MCIVFFDMYKIGLVPSKSVEFFKLATHIGHHPQPQWVAVRVEHKELVSIVWCFCITGMEFILKSNGTTYKICSEFNIEFFIARSALIYLDQGP